MARDHLSSPNISAPILLNGTAGAKGQSLLSQGPSAVPSWGNSVVSVVDTSTITVVNTIAESTLFSYNLPASPTTGSAFRFAIRGTYLNSSGNNRTIRLQFKIGSTLVADSGTSAQIGSNATARSWACDGTLFITGTNAQLLHASGRVSGTSGWSAPATELMVNNTSAVSLSTAQALTMTVIHSNNSTAVSITKQAHTVELLLP